MKLTAKKNLEGTIRVLSVLFLIFLFFPKYSVLNNAFGYALGVKSDLLIIFLYLSDLIVILAYIIGIYTKNIQLWKIAYLIPFFILTAYTTYILKESRLSLTIYYIYLFSLCFVTYETTKSFFQNIAGPKIKHYLLYLFIGLSLLQACIGISQFYYQESLGLHHVGEQKISRDIAGVAKVDTSRGKFIRPYGTFTHPNILGLFLFTGWIACIYGYLHEKKSRLYLLITQPIILTALILTLSRGVLLCMLASFSALIIFVCIKKFHLKQSLLLLLSGLGTIIVIGVVASNLILSRVQFLDSSLTLRQSYSDIATTIIHNNPYTGIGPGGTLFQMKHLNNGQLRVYEIQPIHNYFLQVWVEWGAITLGALLLLFLTIFTNVIRAYTQSKDIQYQWNLLIYLVLITSYFLLMLTDHYFYTSRGPIALLWIVLALGSVINKKPQLVSPETN